MAAKRELWHIVAYLDGLYPDGHASRQAKVNALPVPTLFVGAGIAVRYGGGVVPSVTLRGCSAIRTDIVPERSEWDAVRAGESV